MEDPVEPSLVAKSKRDKKTQRRVCFASIVREAQRLVGQDFTLVVGCESNAGSNKCAWVSEEEFLESDCTGQQVFMSPPPGKIDHYLAHYREGKKLAPHSTSCVLLIPEYERFDPKEVNDQ